MENPRANKLITNTQITVHQSKSNTNDNLDSLLLDRNYTSVSRGNVSIGRPLNEMDKNGDGIYDSNDRRLLAKELGYEGPEELDTLSHGPPPISVSDLDQDGNGVYNIYDDIKRAKKLNSNITKDDLINIFKSDDVNNNGKWDYQDRVELIKRSGIEIKPALIEWAKDRYQKFFGGEDSLTLDDLWNLYNSYT